MRTSTLYINFDKVIKIKRKAINYILDGTKIYKMGGGRAALHCIDYQEALIVVGELYKGICGGYSGRKTMAHQVMSQGYYWTYSMKD